jgi:hypothetical protein
MGRVAVAARGYERRVRPAADAAAIRRYHRQFREGLVRYVATGDAATAVTAPLIYSLLVPFVLLDLWVTAYQAICFRAWGLAPVRRRAYFVIDRHKLAYLNGLEKAHCVYCSYANGLIAYVREVAARTEQYWCPIRHHRGPRDPHARYTAFAPYGDAAGFRRSLPSLRSLLKK